VAVVDLAAGLAFLAAVCIGLSTIALGIGSVVVVVPLVNTYPLVIAAVSTGSPDGSPARRGSSPASSPSSSAPVSCRCSDPGVR
jgi:hypothetical protein